MAKKKQSLFNEEISPACEYCEYGSAAQDGAMVHCAKRGDSVSPYFRCKKFKYSPVRRVPRNTQRLPKMKPEDFAL